MANLINFEEVDNEINVMRIGGKSFLPPDIKWPANPDGKKLTFILNLPVNILNSTLPFHYPENMVISVFTTYDPEDWVLDKITYHGDTEELENIKNGFTKVILHTIGSPRNESEFLIPARKIIVDEKTKVSEEHFGSLFGKAPVFLQNEKLELDNCQFCMQIYGGDFPEENQDIFCLNDSIGYLFLNREANTGDAGLFFTQCT